MALRVLLHGIIPLSFGAFIYVTFRADSILMFSWFQLLKLGQHVEAVRAVFCEFTVPSILIYSVPHGLWQYSFIALILLTWYGHKGRVKYYCVTVAVVISVVAEVGQAFQIVPGTFDWIDLVLIVSSSALPFITLKEAR